MTSRWLFGIYQNYKQDTGIFTSWLTTTAIKCGYTHDALPSHTFEEPTIVKVSVALLLKQAKYLANQKPPIQVPYIVVRSARRAVESRRKCRQLYDDILAGVEDGNAALEKSNEGHEYFVNTMEAILEILGPFLQQKEVVSGAFRQVPSTEANSFELLEVEDCDDDEFSPSSSRNESPKGKFEIFDRSQAESASNPLQTWRSWRVQAFYAIEELQAIRHHVYSVWEDYQNGKVDMIVASFVTEVAFNLIESIEREKMSFKVDGAEIDSLDCALEALDMFTPKQFPLVWHEFGTLWEYSERYFLRFKAEIDNLLKAPFINSEKLRGLYGMFNPAAERDMLSAQEKWSHHGILVSHIISETIFANQVAANRKNGFKLGRVDRLTNGLAKLVTEKAEEATSLAMCAQLQILLDINILLGKRVTRPFKQMELVVAVSRTALESYRKFLGTKPFSVLGGESWSGERNRNLEELIPSIDGNKIVKIKTEHMKKLEGEFEIIPDSPFSLNPVLCGLNCLKIYANIQKEAVKSADEWFFILPVAHLYNALRELGAFKGQWPRMEQMMDIHGRRFIFDGEAPTTVETCHFKARRACGYSATMIGMGEIIPRVRTGPRRKLEGSLGAMSQIIQKHILNDESDMIASLRRLYQVKRTGFQAEDAGDGDFLSFVQVQATQELKYLKFDYWKLNEDCMKVLRALLIVFAPHFRVYGLRHYDDSVGNESRCMREVVPDMLCLVARGWCPNPLIDQGTSVLGMSQIILRSVCLGGPEGQNFQNKHVFGE
ncbi:hypothetical protein HYFRA_00005434 [Hymenoscyphus fraxineus]|uniref:DUF6604 domain-containing protein n=1 Tax=Hymenoscyphus fraxineus TaxID=746836 RepID=A0A9N9PGF4_9HELO|nr:hypothetical protein HYFRA_00005434 [Hymenoscyphus fraxineus]